MACSPKPFDVADKDSWYFGNITREKATDLLDSEEGEGVFLIRDYKKKNGDFVLSVRVDAKICHYVIQKQEDNDKPYYKIGDESFLDIPDLLSFYVSNFLDNTPLKKPAPKAISSPTTQRSAFLPGTLNSPATFKYLAVVRGKFDVDDGDQEDLFFKKDEILFVTERNSANWWTATNQSGCSGKIPVSYVELLKEMPDAYNDGMEETSPDIMTSPLTDRLIGGSIEFPLLHNAPIKKVNMKRQLPAPARAKQQRVPNIYDKDSLKFDKGDIITVLEMGLCGRWKGEIGGREGYFPFTYVEFIDDE